MSNNFGKSFIIEDKEKRKSLYRFLILAFIIILCITILVTSLYFRYARYYLIELLHVQGIEFSELDKDRVVDGVIGAVFETVTLSAIIGLVLVIVVFKHIVGPIRKMPIATKKVAKGDFTVQIDNGRKHRTLSLATLTDADAEQDVPQPVRCQGLPEPHPSAATVPKHRREQAYPSTTKK